VVFSAQIDDNTGQHQFPPYNNSDRFSIGNRFTKPNVWIKLISGFHRALLQSITSSTTGWELVPNPSCWTHTHTTGSKITLPNTDQADEKHQWTTTNFSQVQLCTPWWWIAYAPKHVGV